LSIQSVRPVVAQTAVEPIRVRPIPKKGRPVDYRGAVGRYQIATEAKPTKVAAGDPITLHIGIAGTGPMNRIQAPPIARLPSLTSKFKVPDEPLAGFVDGPQKVFTTTIRAKEPGIDEIPAIPFSFFDPDAEKFVTVHSEPIAIEVEQAETLSLDSIAKHNADSRQEMGPSEDPSGSIVSFRNYSDPQLLQNQTTSLPSIWTLLALLTVPPVIVLGVAILRISDRVSGISGYWRSPLKKLQAELNDAGNPADVSDALSQYLRSRLQHTQSSSSRSTWIGVLRRLGHRDLAIRCERLIHQCDHPPLDASTEQFERLKQEAMLIGNAVDQQLRSKRFNRTSRVRLPRATTAAVAFVFLTVSTVSTTLATEPKTKPTSTLTPEQMLVVLSDANQLYQTAISDPRRGPADRKQFALRSADKYQLLVDSGVQNAKLYFNLANAYHLSGQRGRAIANYHRAIRLDPTNGTFHRHLEHVKELVPKSDLTTKPVLIEILRDANGFVLQHVHPNALGFLAITFWFVAWTLVLFRLLRFNFPWKTLTFVTFILFAVTNAAYGLATNQIASPQVAIISESTVQVRAGDGAQFSEVEVLTNSDGMMAPVRHQRGDWVQVVTPNGNVGWLPVAHVEII
ncbi:MAG: tetratricopeptide repeat protein, partial [Pirellulaceae bacterium]|nr:tetratricopeptide repeat protein [Pirellulaceae bacterium]